MNSNLQWSFTVTMPGYAALPSGCYMIAQLQKIW